MVDVADLGIKHSHAKHRPRDVEARVVPPGKHAGTTEVQECGKDVDAEAKDAAAQEPRPEMVVLPKEELHRMDVDSVLVAATVSIFRGGGTGAGGPPIGIRGSFIRSDTPQGHP